MPNLVSLLQHYGLTIVSGVVLLEQIGLPLPRLWWRRLVLTYWQDESPWIRFGDPVAHSPKKFKFPH